jgi:serine/threonine-protein kinase
MGEVYRARDTKLNRDVAIKVLLDAVAADPDRTARFSREAQVLASLNHPNIGAIYGIEDSGGVRALVMELVEGPTLAERLEQLSSLNAQRSGLALDETLAIAKQVADALEAAHEKGVIHRDLKPANVKVTADGTVKVSTSAWRRCWRPGGRVRRLTMSPTLSVQATYAGVILGTAAYMSPEQARGRTVDRRTDVWAFGCVIFEMLAGARPFDGDDVVEMIGAVVHKEPAWERLPAATPAIVKTTLRRCLEKDPKKRIRDVGDVQLALGGAFETPAPPVASAAPARTPVRRTLALAGAGLVAGMMLMAAAGSTFLRAPAPKAQVTRFSVPLPDGQQFTGTVRGLLALSPDGSTLAYVANQRLFVRDLSGLGAREVTGTNIGGTVQRPAFSPDGQSLAFVYVADRTLKRIAVSGGAPVTICPVLAPLGISWDETGILFGQPGKGILRVSPNGGTPQVMAAIPPDLEALGPQMLPDRKSLLFSLRKVTENWDKAQIVIQSLATGERKILVQGGADGRYLPTGHLVYALSGVLLAVPFDARRGEVTGGPVPSSRASSERVSAGRAAARRRGGDERIARGVPGPVKAVTGGNGRTSRSSIGRRHPASQAAVRARIERLASRRQQDRRVRGRRRERRALHPGYATSPARARCGATFGGHNRARLVARRPVDQRFNPIARRTGGVPPTRGRNRHGRTPHKARWAAHTRRNHGRPTARTF